MSVFHHPYLTRGIVRTAHGAFAISRGRVEVPDDLGASLGWRPVESLDDPSVNRAAIRPGGAKRVAATAKAHPHRRPATSTAIAAPSRT